MVLFDNINILNYNNDKNCLIIIDNTQNRFGPLYMKAIDLAKADNQKRLNKELNFVYIVVVIMTFFVILINLIGKFKNYYKNKKEKKNNKIINTYYIFCF